MYSTFPTTMTLENEHGTYSITLRVPVLTVTDHVENLVRPLLQAAGYHNDSIDSVLGCST